MIRRSFRPLSISNASVLMVLAGPTPSPTTLAPYNCKEGENKSVSKQLSLHAPIHPILTKCLGWTKYFNTGEVALTRSVLCLLLPSQLLFNLRAQVAANQITDSKYCGIAPLKYFYSLSKDHYIEPRYAFCLLKNWLILGVIMQVQLKIKKIDNFGLHPSEHSHLK